MPTFSFARLAGWTKRHVPLLVALLSVLVTLVATIQLDNTTRSRDQIRFDTWIEKTQSNAQERVYSHINFLRSVLGLFIASDHVTTGEFNRFVDSFDILQHYPAIRAVGFALETPTAQLPQAEALIHDQNSAARIWPTPREPVVYPTVYVRALHPEYAHLLGYNIAADPVGREAMEKARMTLGAIASADQLTFSRPDESGFSYASGADCFALYLPVFEEDLQVDRQPQPGSRVIGYLYMVIETDAFWQNVFYPLSHQLLDIYIYNGRHPEPAKLEFTNGLPALPRHGSEGPRFSEMMHIDLAGRSWTLLFQSTPLFESLLTRPLVVPLTFGGGLLASFVLFLLARSLATAWMTAREANEELQRSEAELREVNETLEQRVAERTAVVRRLAGEVTQIEQRERQRIARTLHDHLQQLLVAARLRLQLLGPSASVGPGSEAAAPQDETMALRKELEDLLGEAIQASRSLTIELSPPILHDGGLIDSLRWLARHFHQQHRLEVAVQMDGEASAIDALVPSNVKVTLFEAAREALLNAVKYAGVPEIAIEVKHLAEAGVLELSVIDEGAGFDTSKLAIRGPDVERYGLFSIRERLELLDGQLAITSTPGQGTCITMRVPVPPASEERSVEGRRRQEE